MVRMLLNDKKMSAWGPAVMAVLSVVMLMAGSGCVSRGKYRTAVTERDDYVGKSEMLEDRVAILESDKEVLETGVAALENQNRELKARIDNIARENADLDEMVQKLGFEKQNLGSELTRKQREEEQFRSTYESLVRDLRSEVAAGQVEIEQLRDGLKVNVAQEILFESGSADLDEGGREVLVKVCDQLKQVPYEIVVSGHTDSVRIRGQLAKRYPTNWELGGARAASVVRLFQQEGIEGIRLIVASRGEFQPVASNDTPEGRSRNRRIEIRLRPVMPEESTAAGG